MAIDLILYAAIAAGLVIWLRNILGTRHGEERQRPTIITPTSEVELAQGVVPLKPVKEEKDAVKDSIDNLADNPEEIFSIANDQAREGLIAIAAADKDFEIKRFLNAAQDAFVIGVEAFALGELETLEDLLSKDVFKAFKTAIKEREKRGETQSTQIHSITKTQVIEASLEKNKAVVTLRFEADQTSYLTDKDGKELGGHPDETHKMVDIWTFGRTVRSQDPRWFVIETRGDFEGDNDIIPDAS